MEEYEKPQSHFFKGFLIGGILGALAGIFFAPKSGKELRAAIRKKGSNVLRDGKDIYSGAGKIAQEIIEEANQHLSEASEKVKEILARGEEKEAEAGEAQKGDKAKKKV
jgi:gas vesicle protein